MKKIFIIFVSLLVLLGGCGTKKTEKPAGSVGNSYESGETEAASSPDGEEAPVAVTDEAVIAENSAAVSAMLDCFKALDYEGALALVRESDRELLNVESARANAAYNALLPKMTYETGACYADGEGGRYIDVSITAPSMQDIYGQVFIRMNDAMMNGELASSEEAAEFNNAAITDIVNNGEVKENTMEVRVALAEEDGALRAALTNELLNAMLGDIQGASQQMEETLGESADEYSQAKDAGVFN